MRNVGRLKLGYYPLPQEEGINLRRLLHFTEPTSVLWIIYLTRETVSSTIHLVAFFFFAFFELSAISLM